MAGKMHPTRVPRYTASPVEPAVFEALRDSLPDGWVAWHSLRFTYGRYQLFREIDFLILVPRRGLFVLEVKGGANWTRRDGHWFRGTRGEREDAPLEQVLTSNERLRDVLFDKLGHGSVPHTRVVVFFPEMLVTSTPGGSDFEDRVLTGADLDRLGPRLRGMSERAFPNSDASLPWTRIHDVLHSMWGESWVPSLQLERVQEKRAHELVKLDSEQRALAHDTDVRGRLLVLGGPGTGKSLVAREAAKRHVDEGKRVSYLCFTRALAVGMRRSGLVEAHPIRELALQCLRDEALPVPGGEPATWNNDDWNTMMDSAAELLGASDVARPDVLVVDEVQDFGPREWAVVDALAPRGVPVLAFGDVAQLVLAHAALEEKRFDVTLRLRRAYRTPDPVLELASQLREGSPRRIAESPHVHLERLRDGEATADGVRRALQWLVDRKVEARDIAVLSLASVRRMTTLPIGETIAGLPTARADDDDAPERAVVDTALRFKGVERPWIVLFDLEETASPEGKTRAFIGATRATMGVVLVDR